MPRALVALGSNLGDRQATLDRAVALLEESPGIESVRASRWHATLAVGGPTGQPEFLNGAVLLLTSLEPHALAQRLTEIEQTLGRQRTGRWGPRMIDLDLLLYDTLTLAGPVKVPHPRMAFRRFVLKPAAEVGGDMVHPTIGWTVERLRDHLQTAADYVAVSGATFDAAQRLAQVAARETGWTLLGVSGAGELSRPAGSPSFTKSRAIEFLREQADIVSKHFEADRSQGAISSFWIEDLLAIGEVLWPGELDEAWQSLKDKVVSPKLLVVSDGNPPAGMSAGTIELWHRLQQSRRQRAGRMGIGPTLWVSSDHPAEAEAELAAAIQSTQPRREPP